MKLYRAVGLYEMEKILELKGTAFPARLPEQPIFYPVLNYDYAKQMAEDWNQNDSDSGFVGFVTKFEVKDNYIEQYQIHTVGSDIHKELWIPSQEINVFNENIIGSIKVIDACYGKEYVGINPTGLSGFKEKSLLKQFDILKITKNYNEMDFSGTVVVEWMVLNLNLLYWKQNISEEQFMVNVISDRLELNNKLFVDIHYNKN